VQLYDAAAGLVILVILYLIRNYRPWPGFHFWFFVALYGAARLFFEIFRARPYLIGDGFLGMQVLALVAIVVALAVMAYNFTRDSEEESPVKSV
jgi:prolipoprotein diacylglyceryltransferase